MHKNNIIIIGLGNEFISDDGIGIYTVRELKKNNFFNDFTIKELSVGGLELFDYLCGYEKAIIVDAFITGSQPAGTIYKCIQTNDKEFVKIKSSHQVDLMQVLGLAKALDIKIPDKVIVYGVEAGDITTFRCKCTPEVEVAIPRLVKLIQNDIMENNLISNKGCFEIVN